jgi:ATP-dependent DNA helicase RecQ
MAERIDGSPAPDEVKQVQRSKLNQLYGFLDGLACRRGGVRRYFGETDVQDCGQCDVCTNPNMGHDSSQWAKMALSAVIRCEESFGRGRIISHLIGAEPDGALETRFAERTTYGIGKGLNKTAWRRVLDQLLFDGILAEQNRDGFPILTIACPDLARSVLKGEAPVFTREDPVQAGGSKRAVAKLALDDDLDPVTLAVYRSLRTWRLETARAAGIPPYVVFHDTVLRQVALARPTTSSALMLISGIGEAKARRYGQSILTLLSAA